MNYLRIVIRESFPTDLDRSSSESYERSAEAIEALREFVDAEPPDRRTQADMLRMGRLITGASWPHMLVEGLESASHFDDGMRVPSMIMSRDCRDGGRVTVRTVLGESRVLVDVDESVVDTTGILHAGFPYAETPDLTTSGKCFVKDNRLEPNGPFYDSANEGLPAMVEPTQAAVRYLLDAID